MAENQNHKCWVFKLSDAPYLWVTRCCVIDCFLRNGYLESETWEEAMLEALHHRMRNSF